MVEALGYDTSTWSNRQIREVAESMRKAAAAERVRDALEEGADE